MFWNSQSMCLGYVLCFVATTALGIDLSSVPACTDTALENPGYSTTLQNDRTVWTHCGFPNPKLEPARCGRDIRDLRDLQVTTFDLCDPDAIFTDANRSALDEMLWHVESVTPYQCTPWHGTALNRTILLVAVTDLRISDLSTNLTCINNCGEVKPDLDVALRNPTDEEIQAAIESFASGLLSNYETYFCDSLVVLVYWDREQKVSTAMSSGLSSTLPSHVTLSAEQTAESVFQEGYQVLGLVGITINYSKYLIGFTPAYVILIIHMSLLVITAAMLICHLTTGNKGDYFDSQKQWKVAMTTMVKVIFGIWIVEKILLGIAKFQEEVRLWMIVIPLIGFIIALVAAVFLILLEAEDNTVASGTV